MKHRPCDNCPFRKDAPREHWDQQHFLDIAKNCRGDGFHEMMCHKSGSLPPKEQFICAGWAAVEGFAAVGLRLAVIHGRYDPKNLDAEGIDLFDTFDDMLKANKIKGASSGRVFEMPKRRGKR